MNTRKNFVIVSAGLLLAMACTTPRAEANSLVNAGFESGPASLTSYVNVLGPPFLTGQSGEKAGVIETGPDNGVTPHTGSFMLAETNSGYAYTSTYQATNLPYFAGEQVSLSAWFNAPAALSGLADADVVVTCYASSNSYPTNLGSSSATLVLSPTPQWQQLTLPTFTVPAGTNYILSNVGFLNSSLIDSTGVIYPGFVDDANLTVTPEPSTFALLGAARHRPAGLRMAKATTG